MELIRKNFGEFLEEREIERVKDLPLGKGEKAAISLAINEGKAFLSDDKKQRKFARNFDLETIGTLLWNLKKRQNQEREICSVSR